MTDCTLHIRILSSSRINTLKLRFINLLIILKMHRLKFSILSSDILLYNWFEWCFNLDILELNGRRRVRYNKFLLILLVINSIIMILKVIIYLSERLMRLLLTSNVGDRLPDRLGHRLFNWLLVLLLIRSLIFFVGVWFLFLLICVFSCHFTNN